MFRHLETYPVNKTEIETYTFMKLTCQAFQPWPNIRISWGFLKLPITWDTHTHICTQILIKTVHDKD